MAMASSQMLNVRHLYAQVRGGQTSAFAGRRNYRPRTCNYSPFINLLFLPATVIVRGAVRVRASPYQLVVRVPIDGNPREQSRTVTRMPTDFRKRIETERSHGVLVEASLYDRSAPLRRLHSHDVGERALNL
jgi:hypothetical protein